MNEKEVTWILLLVGCVAWALIDLKRRVDGLDEDVELILDGDTELARKLRGKRVARETKGM